MGWEFVKLGDLVHRKIGYGIVQPGANVDVGVPVIKVNNIISGLSNIELLEKTTTDIDARYTRTRLVGGELVISLVGSVGKTAIVPKTFAGCNLVRATGLIDIKDEILAKWVKYYIDSPLGQAYINSNVNTTVQVTLNIKSLVDMPIPLPEQTIREKIVAILSSIDDKIELNRRINANLEQQAQALFDEIMSCELEYDLIANIPHVIETGKRPKGGVASITSGIPSIGAENIKGLGYYDYSKTKYITEEFATTLKKGFVNGYELLIYKDGGKPGYFIPNFSIFGNGFPYNKMALNEHVFLLDFRNKGYNFFAYFYFQQEKIMRYLNAQGSKAAIPGINRNDIENISIPTIQNKVIQDFCRQIENIITHILNNASESRKLSIVRDTLLPKLMSGEIKV